MELKTKSILTVNAGSSSIKFVLHAADESHKKLLGGTISGIGQSEVIGEITNQETAQKQKFKVSHSDMPSAIHALIRELKKLEIYNVVAVGHRIVHGGSRYSSAQIINDELLLYLQSISSIDPEHTPAALALIHQLGAVWPNALHVACFDTAFFYNLPRQAQIVPLPRRYERYGVRRYGFHGLSYTYVQAQFTRIAGDDAAAGRVIYAHLGSGASLAATKNRMPMDTTMGFSPASGIVMSTRSGDIDPSLGWYLHQSARVTTAAFNHIVNKESGLIGISETTADMYTLLQQESSDVRSAEAIEVFCYQVKKAIGALSVVIGGLDSLIFTGGIGEQSAVLRQRICSGIEFLGIELDKTRNDQMEQLISSDQSRVGVHVIPTDEAYVIADQTFLLLNQQERMQSK